MLLIAIGSRGLAAAGATTLIEPKALSRTNLGASKRICSNVDSGTVERSGPFYC